MIEHASSTVGACNRARHEMSTLVQIVGRIRRADRIIILSTSQSTRFTIALASLLKGAAYTLHIDDRCAKQAFATGAYKSISWIESINEFFDRWLYKHTSKIIVARRDIKELIDRKTTGLDVPIVIIPDCAESGSLYEYEHVIK